MRGSTRQRLERSGADSYYLATLPEFASEQWAQKFVRAIDGTEAWLDQEFSGANLPEVVKQDAERLRRYLRHCRRQVKAGKGDRDALDRRRRKIEEMMVELWKARQDER